MLTVAWKIRGRNVRLETVLEIYDAVHTKYTGIGGMLLFRG